MEAGRQSDPRRRTFQLCERLCLVNAKPGVEPRLKNFQKIISPQTYTISQSNMQVICKWMCGNPWRGPSQPLRDNLFGTDRFPVRQEKSYFTGMIRIFQEKSRSSQSFTFELSDTARLYFSFNRWFQVISLRPLQLLLIILSMTWFT